MLLNNLWKKFIYGWMFDGTRFFLSGYPTKESRFMYRRQIMDRLERLAPFLVYENDPYIVLHEGRLIWLVDAYTVSSRYPYSEPFSGREDIPGAEAARYTVSRSPASRQFGGVNYIRNAVKVAVDAYHGDVTFYVYDETDPIIRVWRNVFPELFTSREDMPEGLKNHVRYPAAFLLAQSLMYTKYHMTDPAVFYNQEDLWVRATEKYYQQVQPVEPYYIMWKAPGGEDPQFTLILPFTPKNKQVLIGWMAGLCDGANYGRLLAYKFPKEKRILGPQQVETKIDQDSYLSGQLTLWDQRGSKVIRGNVLALPIDKTLLYVEPIYLQAETAAYPELRLVAVMHGDNLSYAETFEQALEGLFEGRPPARPAPGEQAAPAAGRREWIDRAGTAFREYLHAMGRTNFTGSADALGRLEEALEELLQSAPPASE